MGEQLALVPGEQARELEPVRRQRDRLAAEGDRALVQVDDELADSSTGPPAGPARRSAARRRASSSSIPNGFVDVVVGAGVERRDLLVLVADRREHEHRRGRPARAAPGRRPCRFRPEARDRGSTASGRRASRPRRAPPLPSRRRRPRSRRRGGSSAARAGSAARRRPRARAARSSRPASAGIGGRSASTNVAPCPGRRLGPDPSAVRLREAPGDREPRPLPLPRAAPRSNGSKIRSQLVASRPGPRSRTRKSDLAAGARAELDPVGGRREP